MKLFLYSDVHISKTSSILPISIKNSKNSYRQQMILDTAKYMREIIDEYKPDLIINLGDTFDQNIITSYDVKIASEFFKILGNTKQIIITGNHDMLNYNYNAIELLDNIENLKVINKPESIENLAFMPYCEQQDIFDLPEGDFLFSHLDIENAIIRKNILSKSGVKADVLQSKYKLIYNGHIHKYSIMRNLINVGSVTTHSFADDDESVPQCYLFDTETLDLKIFKPKCCPLFRHITINSIEDLKEQLKNIDRTYKYIINCKCEYDLKMQVKEVLKSDENIVNFKITTMITNTENKQIDETLIEQLSNVDIKKSLKEFLKEVDLKNNIDMYYDVIDSIKIK